MIDLKEKGSQLVTIDSDLYYGQLTNINQFWILELKDKLTNKQVLWTGDITDKTDGVLLATDFITNILPLEDSERTFH